MSDKPTDLTEPQDDLDAVRASADRADGNASPPAGATPDAATDRAATDEAAKSASSPPAEPIALPDFVAESSGPSANTIDLLRDVNLHVKIELGRARMLVDDVLKLGKGSVVELDKLAGDPVDVLVNERLVARGEVLVLNDNFCVRISEIVSPAGEVA